MSDNSDSLLISALRRQMTIATAREVVSAGNLANVNTPGYKAKQVEFSEALDASLNQELTVTDPRHVQAEITSGPRTTEAEGLEARRDGNTVQIDRELLEMTQAAGEFQRAQTALAAKFRLVRYAINEGR